MAPQTKNPVIYLMKEQEHVSNKGGTMRLGAYPCAITKGSHAFEAYGSELISERHRHRYEFNNKYMADYEKSGMVATGINPNGGLVEIVEVSDHPWFVGVQFHPEYKSTVVNPHPLFVNFVEAALKNKK
jgi:CTP synthase